MDGILIQMNKLQVDCGEIPYYKYLHCYQQQNTQSLLDCDIYLKSVEVKNGGLSLSPPTATFTCNIYQPVGFLVIIAGNFWYHLAIFIRIIYMYLVYRNHLGLKMQLVPN